MSRIYIYMVKVQQNNQTKALFVQIPKAIATAKGLNKGMEVDFLIDKEGDIKIKIRG